MRPITVSLGSVTTSVVIPLDQYVAPFAVGLFLIVSGTNTSTVEYTSDDPFASTFVASSASWTSHPNITAKSANTDSNLAFPARAVRLNCTAWTSGTATLRVLQAGITT